MLKKIASNTLAQVFSKVITAIITIFLLWLITNYLSIELFGTYNKIFNYIFIFAFLVDLGLYAMTIKEISADKKNSEYIFWNILTLRLISATAIIILSIWVAYFLPWYNSNLVLYWIFIASIFSFFSLINSSLLALMQAHMKIEFSIISVVINKLFVLGFTFYIIKYLYPEANINWYNEAFLFIISAVTIWMFINMILNYIYARKITKIKLLFDYTFIRKIFLKSLPYGIALFLSVVYTKIDIILISLMEDWIIAERSIALYSLPLKIMDVFMIIWWFFMNSLLPSLSENYKLKNYKKINEIVTNAIKIMYSMWIILISLWLIFKDYVVKIIANDNYLQITEYNNYTSSDAFSVILFMILFFYIWIVFSYLLIATDRQKKLLKISIILTIINIVWNILIIPYYSFIWAWVVTVLTQVVFVSLTFFYSKEVLKVTFPINFMAHTTLYWLLIYFFLGFIVNNFSMWLYLDLIYPIVIFILYIWLLWQNEKKYLNK